MNGAVLRTRDVAKKRFRHSHIHPTSGRILGALRLDGARERMCAGEESSRGKLTDMRTLKHFNDTPALHKCAPS